MGWFCSINDLILSKAAKGAFVPILSRMEETSFKASL